MTQVEIVNALRTEAQKNKAANAVFFMWAMRDRARQQVMIHSLNSRMKREGFNFERQEYVLILKRLAALGFGTLDVDSSGRVVGLKEIKTTLQSIGKVACGDRMTPDFARLRRNHNRYQKMQVVTKAAEALADAPMTPVAAPTTKGLTILIPVNNGKAEVTLPKDLTAQELGEFIAKLRTL